MNGQNSENERRHEQANSFGITSDTTSSRRERGLGIFTKELANILVTSGPWVRAHAKEIPGFERLGEDYRFRRGAIKQWLGSLDPLLDVNQVAALLTVPKSWVYANPDDIPRVYGSAACPFPCCGCPAVSRWLGLRSDHLRYYKETATEAPRNEDRGARTLSRPSVKDLGTKWKLFYWDYSAILPVRLCPSGEIWETTFRARNAQNPLKLHTPWSCEKAFPAVWPG